MPIQTVFRLKKYALMMALAAAYPVISHSADAAKVDFSTGNVVAVNPAGAQRSLSKGADIGSGESVLTGDGGRAQLRFTDGGMVSLQPGSEFKVDNYQFSGKEDGQEKGFFSLLKGGLRSITGLVGRTNKNAYKVNTSVATIGIRGTEFTIAYTGANSISVSTGEGMIEVCNNAGCALVPAGSSAIINGPNSEVKRTEIKPRLDPAQPGGDVRPVFATSDTRADSGLVAPVSPPLISGGNYMVAYSGTQNGSGIINYTGASTSATFDEYSALQEFVSGGNTFKASAIAASFSADGAIGWGRWSSGAVAPSGDFLKEFHYVVGVPTSNISGISLTNATYQLAGYTMPTSSTGVTGNSVSGSLDVTIAGGYSTVKPNVNLQIGGATYNLFSLGGTMSGGPGTPQFSSSVAKGFFVGDNAAYAGLTYKFNSGVPAVGEVYGAAAFKR